jgi:hypothetical protein
MDMKRIVELERKVREERLVHERAVELHKRKQEHIQMTTEAAARLLTLSVFLIPSATVEINSLYK